MQHVAGASLVAQLFFNLLGFFQARSLSLLENENRVKL